MKILPTILGLFLCFVVNAADINITNVTHASSIPPGSFVLGTTGSVTRLLPTSLLGASTITNSTNFINYGSSGKTNWTTTLGTGFLNTNTAGGFVIMSNGNVTASTGFAGNASGLTNLPISSITTPGQILTNRNVGAVTLSNDLILAGASSDLTVDGIITNSTGIYASGTNTMGKLRIGGAAETYEALNVTGAGRFSSGLAAGNGNFPTIYMSGQTAIKSIAVNRIAIMDIGTTTTADLATSNLFTGSVVVSNSITSYGDVTISGSSSDLTVGGYTTNTHGTYNLGTCYATNFVLSSPRWVDSPVVWTWGTGSTAPARTAYSPANGISALGWADSDVADFQCQVNHGISPSNSTLYTEFHLHVLPMASVPLGSDRKKFTVTWMGAALNGTIAWTETNVFDNVLLTTGKHTLIEAGHTSFTNWYPGISGKMWGTVLVSSSTASNYSGTITVDADFHYPITVMGSSADTTP